MQGDLEQVPNAAISRAFQNEMFEACEKRLIEMVARGEPLSAVLTALCGLFEELYAGSVTSVLLADSRSERSGTGLDRHFRPESFEV